MYKIVISKKSKSTRLFEENTKKKHCIVNKRASTLMPASKALPVN